MSRHRRAVLALAALAAVLAGRPVLAQPAGFPIEVTGATYVEVDDASGMWRFTGNPVVISRGSQVFRAPSITYDSRGQIVHATGGASYADQASALSAAEITAWLPEERMVAMGGVTLRQGVVVYTGERVEYRGRTRTASATGRGTVSAPEGTVSADRIEARLDREEATAEGNVQVVVRAGMDQQRAPIEGTAATAVLRRQEGIVVLSGGATVRQGGNVATAQTITVDFRRNRVTASGQAHLVAQPGR